MNQMQSALEEVTRTAYAKPTRLGKSSSKKSLYTKLINSWEIQIVLLSLALLGIMIQSSPLKIVLFVLAAGLNVLAFIIELVHSQRWGALDFQPIKRIVIEKSPEAYKKRVFVETPKHPFDQANEILSAYDVKLFKDEKSPSIVLLKGRKKKRTFDCLNITDEGGLNPSTVLWYQNKPIAQMRRGEDFLLVYTSPLETMSQSLSEYTEYEMPKCQYPDEEYIGYQNQQQN